MGMNSARTTSIDQLLRHEDFVRRLARGLVRDKALAEDLAQEAWARALRKPPRQADSAQGWFGTVLRRLASRTARDEGRRGAREREVARPEAQPSGLEVGERLQLERNLVQAVEGLREPYRSTVFLRYFEGHSPRAIAAREGVPVATVKTRLRRALELLRETLDRRHGSRAWALGLTRLAGAPGNAVPIGVLAAGLLAAGAAFWVLQRTPDADPLVELPVALSAEAVAESEPETSPSEPQRLQTSREQTRTTSAPEVAKRPRIPLAIPDLAQELPQPSSQEDGLVLRGRVLFPDRSPVADASVALGDLTTRTGRDGRFALNIEEDGSSRQRSLFGGMRPDTALVAWFEGWVPATHTKAGAIVLAARGVGSDDAIEPIELVLSGRALGLAGTILDRDGRPAEGWRTSLLDSPAVYSGPYRPFTAEEFASGVTRHVETGPDGRFAFAGLALGHDYRVRAWNPKTLEQVTSPPLAAGTLDALLLASGDPWRPSVDGIVVGLDGSPLEGVRCRLSMIEYGIEGSSWNTTGQEVHTDAHGRFEFQEVPPSEIFIRFNAENGGTSRTLLPDESGRDWVVELVRNGSFHFECPTGAIESVQVLDEAGEPLRIQQDLGNGRTVGMLELESSPDGGCQGNVSELARWLVLMKEGREVTRLPLFIRNGTEARLRW